MKTLTVKGGSKLSGDVVVHGSKNAALPILFASLLFSEPIELSNVPAITDVSAALALLSALGVKVVEKRRGTLFLDPSSARPAPVPPALSGSLRGSLYLLGAAAGRLGELFLPRPGGCNFGARPIDLHLAVLRAMGLSTTVTGEGVFVKGRPKGAVIDFATVSVGATVNAILAAVLADGRTILTGAAREPHVLDLVAFLRSAGARIGCPSPGTFVIDGVPRLSGTAHRVCPDMIEAGTGVDSLSLSAPSRPRARSVETAPYPGFPTDLQPQFTALACLAEGESAVCDPIFPTRFGYVPDLVRMGAKIGVSAGCAEITGVPRLHSADLTAPDLRAGAALTLAALAAEGESRIARFDLIERGYADYVKTLTSLGARVSLGGDGA